MGDYKRMLLAVVIAALFIYIWTSFFAKPQPPGEIGAGADSTMAGAPGGGIPPVPARGDDWSPPLDPREDVAPGAYEADNYAPGTETSTEITRKTAWVPTRQWGRTSVETDFCIGELVATGGGLSSWKLKDFLDLQDEPVDMVNLAQGGKSDLHFELIAGDERLSFEDVPFELSEVYRTEPGVAKVLKLSATDTAGASIVKTYTFYHDRYFFDLHVEATGFESGDGLSCALTWSNGLLLTEPNEKSDLSNFAAISLIGEEFIKDKMGKFDKEPVKTHQGNVIWTGVRNKYFVAAMIPADGTGRAVRTWGDKARNLVATQLYSLMEISGSSASASFRVYAGPMEFNRLRALENDKGKPLGIENDVYQRFKFMAPLNHLVFALMTWTYGLVPNYGIVIILVSVLIKLVFFPLTRSSLKSMSAMKRVQPELEALKKKLKGDPKKMNQAQMELFKKHKVNPMGGCLPILVQMPMFFALYNVLVESVQLRRAPFVGWIDDLSAPDTLFSMGTFPIHVLPLIMAATQLAQPAMGASTDSRQQMMKYMMPIFMLVIFYGLPSGLVLYWTVNNVATAVQQYLMNRSEKGKEGDVTVAPAKPSGRKRRANNK
jgi:YidC/Oxa1 family membrane protein insertase